MTQLTPRVLCAAGALVAGGIALVTVASGGPHHAHHRDKDPLIAHEWGTFTTFQGSDGLALDGLQHEVEHLPGFVHRRTVATRSAFARFGDPSRDVPVRRVRSKMETPVIYFHSNTRRRVRLRVGFSRGLMSHYYPAPTAMTPAPAPGEQLDLANIERSTLEWELEIIPRSHAKEVRIPALPASDHYAQARLADSAFVRARSGDKVEDEQFVFYRGLGHTAPALTVDARRRSRATVSNRGAHGIPMAFAVQMKGDVGRFAPIGPIEAGATVEFALQGAFTPKAEVIDALGVAMHKQLVARGLFASEAHAMVQTWSHQWFGDDGTRILYIVPPSYVDEVLPLSMTPAPDKLVRVFVGRLEYMTPEVERQVEAALRLAGYGNDAERRRGNEQLAGFGRFMEPMVRGVRARTTDARVRSAADAVLGSL